MQSRKSHRQRKGSDNLIYKLINYIIKFITNFTLALVEHIKSAIIDLITTVVASSVVILLGGFAYLVFSSFVIPWTLIVILVAAAMIIFVVLNIFLHRDHMFEPPPENIGRTLPVATEIITEPIRVIRELPLPEKCYGASATFLTAGIVWYLLAGIATLLMAPLYVCGLYILVGISEARLRSCQPGSEAEE